jgi:hypothetical protein
MTINVMYYVLRSLNFGHHSSVTNLSIICQYATHLKYEVFNFVLFILY